MELEGQRILVMGATGFIGGQVARRLLGQNHLVRVMARRIEKAADLEKSGAEVVMGDLGDEDLLERGARLRGGIHCAAQAADMPTRLQYQGPNVGGSENMLVASAKAEVKRFLSTF